jgi:hypothetical protein
MPSRRDTLAVGVTAAVAGLAGCAGVSTSSDSESGGDTKSDGDTGSGDDSATPSPSPVASPAESFTARLTGPETDAVLFEDGDAAEVSAVEKMQSGPFGFTVTLTESAAEGMSKTFREAGVGDDPSPFEIVLELDGSEKRRFGISPGLAESIASGDWEGEFVLQFEDEQAAKRAHAAFETGGSDN